NTVIQPSGKRTLQNPQIHMLHMKDHLEIIAELLSHTGRKEKLIYHQDQKYRSRHIEHTKLNSQGFFHSQSTHRQGKTGNKSSMDPGTGSGRIHTHYHNCSQEKVSRSSVKKWQKQRND